MKHIVIPMVLAGFLATPASARDPAVNLPLADAIAAGESEGKRNASIKFYLDGQPTPKIQKKMGEDTGHAQTSGVDKSDETACNRAALSALIKFQASAKQKGANAVVGMHSAYKEGDFKSPTEYQCHAGNVMVRVTLRGTYAKI